MQFIGLLSVIASIATAAEQTQVNYYSDNCSSYIGQVDVTWATELYGGADNCYNYHSGARYEASFSLFSKISAKFIVSTLRTAMRAGAFVTFTLREIVWELFHRLVVAEIVLRMERICTHLHAIIVEEGASFPVSVCITFLLQ